jgi:hypothetical protein
LSPNDPAEINPYSAPTTDIASGGSGARSPAALRISAGITLILAALVNLARAIAHAIGGAMGIGAAPATDLVYALFLLFIVAGSIPAAVFLFLNKRPGFIVGAALLAGVGEIVGGVMGRRVPLTLFGSGAALLAFIAGVSIANRTALAERSKST